MTTRVSVHKGRVVTEEDSIVLTAGAYQVEVEWVNGVLNFVYFEEMDHTQGFQRKFSDADELVIIRDLLSATLIEMKLEEGEYDSI